MKLLIKIYLENNSYDIVQILDVFKLTINKDTELHLMINDLAFDFKPYNYTYLSEISPTKMINNNLSNLDWDIVLPILKPCIFSKNFDTYIKKIYEEKFPNLDGVLWLNDNIQKDINTFPIIGRKYFDRFGYIYNPAYKRKNFEEEFTEVMKLTGKYYYVEQKFVKILPMKSDDDNIYELRKKLNFGLWT